MLNWIKKLFGFKNSRKEIIQYFLQKSTQALLRGEFTPAIKYIDRALEFNPKSSSLLVAKAVIFKDGLKNKTEALRILKLAMETKTNNSLEENMAKERARVIVAEIMKGNEGEGNEQES